MGKWREEERRGEKEKREKRREEERRGEKERSERMGCTGKTRENRWKKITEQGIWTNVAPYLHQILINAHKSTCLRKETSEIEVH